MTDAPCKLRKETPPAGYLEEERWWEKYRVQVAHAHRDVTYMGFLFNRDTGLFGFREKNPHRMYPRRWLENFIVIQDKHTRKMVPLVLNEAQRLLLATIIRMLRRNVPVSVCILKARQQGISTFVAALLLWIELTVPYTRGLLMGSKKDVATVIHERMGDMIHLLTRKRDGKKLLITLSTENRRELTICVPVRSTTIIDSAESPDYRGDTLSFLHALEPAEWPNAKNKANAVMQMVPDAPWTFKIIEGTARGETGWFADTWKAGWRKQRDGSPEGGLAACFYPWFIHKNYRWSHVYGRPLPNEMLEAIKATITPDEQILLRHEYVQRGVGRVTVNYDQLAWRRYAIAEKCQGDVQMFHQEYPAFPEEAFLATGAKFFDAHALAMQRATHACLPNWRGDLVDPEGEALMKRTLDDLELRIK